MSKIKCYNCVESGHFACDCPISCDNTNIAQESEQNKKVENMLDLDNIILPNRYTPLMTIVRAYTLGPTKLNKCVGSYAI